VMLILLPARFCSSFHFDRTRFFNFSPLMYHYCLFIGPFLILEVLSPPTPPISLPLRMSSFPFDHAFKQASLYGIVARLVARVFVLNNIKALRSDRSRNCFDSCGTPSNPRITLKTYHKSVPPLTAPCALLIAPPKMFSSPWRPYLSPQTGLKMGQHLPAHNFPSFITVLSAPYQPSTEVLSPTSRITTASHLLG